MIPDSKKTLYYQALLARQSEYEGLFYVGVKTTGIFCRPTCPARKPKFDNCEFFANAKAALIAGFRPCKRCQPLYYPGQDNPTIEKLIRAIEANPEQRWKASDLRALGIDDSTARRQFQKRFGMTFLEYTRARRMGLAMQKIKAGSAIIDAQLDTGYESSSGFRDAFTRIMGAVPTQGAQRTVLIAYWLETLLGPMLAIADDTGLYLLEFADRRGLAREIERLRSRLKAAIIPGKNAITNSIKQELTHYFSGLCLEFKTPIHLLGSAFQCSVWAELQNIPIGQTRAYLYLKRLSFRNLEQR